MLTLAMLTSPWLSADDKGPPKATLPKGTPAEQVKELISQHEKAIAAFRKLLDAAKTEAEPEKLGAFYPAPHPYADLLFQIAQKNPDDAAAVDALIWVYRNTRSAKAKTILLRDHLLNPIRKPKLLPL
jgi:hypothetical protein